MKYLKHFIVVTKHKYFVMVECFKDGLYWQGIVHDLSKYSPGEFIQSARYFRGDKSPLIEIREVLGYSTAWLKHKGRNKHHWEYWVDFRSGQPTPCQIPEKYLKEMACDMLSATKVYLKGNYEPVETLIYFDKYSPKWIMWDEDKKKLRKMIEERVKPKKLNGE